MAEVWITAARRTAVCPRGGAFAHLLPHEMAAPVIAAALADAGIAPEDVDELILSNALGAGGNPARLAALAAGLPERVAGLSIDRQCAGGLDAIRIAVAMVASGQARVVVAGGAESYSRRPLRLATAPGAEPEPYDAPPFTPWPDRDPDMTEAAAALAARLNISRAMQEDWALRSHRLAMQATFPEMVVLAGQARDPFARNLSARTLARAPALAGSVTAGTTAVAADAAAFAVVTSSEYGRRAARAMRVIAAETCGAAPDEPGLSPVPAINATLLAAGLQPAALERVELMEAYAVQALACLGACQLPEDRVNLGGGALARGHPIGASGAVLVARLFHDLRDGAGLAAIAAAGGIGSALVIAP